MLNLFADYRLEIPVGDFPFAIRQVLEAGERFIEILTGEVVSQFLESCPNRTAATEFAQ